MKQNLHKWILKATFALTLFATANGSAQTYYNLQWPPTGNITETQSHEVFAQAWESGVTESPGAAVGLEAWIGISPKGQNTNPNTWTMWIPATFNSQVNNNDEFKALIGANLAPGTYYYASRFRLNNGNYNYGGYPNGAWNGTTQTSGVLTVNSNPNCDTVWYADTDGDGYGNADSSILGCNQPDGYVLNSNDCNDTSADLYNNADLYVDNDNDGYTVGVIANICFGAEMPEGYSVTSLGEDCNDEDASLLHAADMYIDNDGDGYHGDNIDQVCYGTTVPDGYSLTSLGEDCDDSDDTKWRADDMFVDNDGDGYHSDNIDQVCYGEFPPAGLSLTTDGPDCDDTNVNLFNNADLYIDSDNDGYDNGIEADVCFGTEVPAGYSSTTNGTDCDDDNANANPMATEIQGNHIDENCNGMEDDAVGEFYTQVKASQCGGTLDRIYNAIVAVTDIPNVTRYYFEITNTENNEKQTIDGTDFYFQLTDLDSYEYETTYSIRIGLDVNNVWQGYGPACLVTSPSLTTGASAIVIPQCGITLEQRNRPIFITGPNFISSFEIRVTNLNTTEAAIITRTEPWFTLKMIPALYDHNTNYSVEVRISTTEGYSEWSTPCTVSTPAAPAGKLTNTAVSLTAVAYPNPFSGEFSLNLANSNGTAAQVKVYDMLGKVVEVREIDAKNSNAQQIGNNLPAGDYNVVVTQDGVTDAIRVIKR